MTRTDWSSPAELMEIEAAASEYAEDFVGLPPAEALFNRKLPERYDVSKEWDEKKDRWRRKPGDVMSRWTSAGFRWRVTYDFPAEVRDNSTPSGKAYGGKGMTYRRLYLILNERFFGGRPFLDTYFDTVFPGSWLEDYTEELLESIREEVTAGAEEALGRTRLTREGRLDRRYSDTYGARKRLDEYTRKARAWEQAQGIELARLFKEDIKGALASGQLPVQASGPRPETAKRRASAGLPEEPLLYATGRLIDSVRLYVDLEGDRTWRTRQGILV